MTAAPLHPDAFPTTMRTWLTGALDRGEAGLALARTHVMDTYAWPLSVYFRGSGFRSLGDADDAVRGFFADRLSRPEFLDDWVASGRPLRFWLIVAFKHHLHERIRRERRDAMTPLPEVERAGAAPDSEREFRREAARALVDRACRCAAEECEAEGLGAHWAVFSRHCLSGGPYAALASEHGVDERRARVMARTAANKLRGALRDLAGWPGCSSEDVESELASLLEDLAP